MNLTRPCLIHSNCDELTPSDIACRPQPQCSKFHDTFYYALQQLQTDTERSG